MGDKYPPLLYSITLTNKFLFLAISIICFVPFDAPSQNAINASAISAISQFRLYPALLPYKSEELNIVKSSHITFYTFTTYIL